MVLQFPVVLGGVPRFLMVLAIQVLVALHGISCHLIWPFEECLILDLFQDLMYRVSEYSMNCLRIGGLGLPCKVSPWSVVVIESVRPEILSFEGQLSLYLFPAAGLLQPFLYLSIWSMS